MTISEPVKELLPVEPQPEPAKKDITEGCILKVNLIHPELCGRGFKLAECQGKKCQKYMGSLEAGR